MIATLAPRSRLLVAGALLALASAAIVLAAAGPKVAAQLVLGVGAIGAAVVLTAKQQSKKAFALSERLTVVQRVGLSTRNAAALVEVDGQRFLIVHGDGFATVHPTQSPTLVAPAIGGTK